MRFHQAAPGASRCVARKVEEGSRFGREIQSDRVRKGPCPWGGGRGSVKPSQGETRQTKDGWGSCGFLSSMKGSWAIKGPRQRSVKPASAEGSPGPGMARVEKTRMGSALLCSGPPARSVDAAVFLFAIRHRGRCGHSILLDHEIAHAARSSEASSGHSHFVPAPSTLVTTMDSLAPGQVLVVPGP